MLTPGHTLAVAVHRPFAEQLVELAAPRKGDHVLELAAGESELTTRLRAAVAPIGEVTVVQRPWVVPARAGHLDLAVSLFALEGEDGLQVLSGLRSSTARVVAVMSDNSPSYDDAFRSAWRQVLGADPPGLSSYKSFMPPRGWHRHVIADVARFDGIDQLLIALTDERGLHVPVASRAALRAALAANLEHRTAADGTLRIPVEAALFRLETHLRFMTREAAERIRDWHEDAYQAAKAEGTTIQTFHYLGLTIVVPPGVQPVTGASDLLGNAVLAEVRPGERVLDMGTGSGVNAVLAASTAASVLAVDLNPDAVAAARANVEVNGVSGIVEVRESDVFSAVTGDFDVIIFDPPFRWFSPRDALEGATTDANYGALTRFVEQASAHLSPRGRVLIFFGSTGNIDYLRHLLDRYGFAVEDVGRRELIRGAHHVDYFVFRVTR